MNGSQLKWYDKTWLVVLLCIFFFPVGLYALWQNSSIRRGWKIVVTILIGFTFIGFMQDTEGTAPATPKTERVLSDREKISNQFNGMDNSHIKFEQLIKANMNDADSYEHVETSYISDKPNSIFVTTKFRGTNAFGAKVINQKSARFSYDGDLLEIIE